jgi:hypothetical protein
VSGTDGTPPRIKWISKFDFMAPHDSQTYIGFTHPTLPINQPKCDGDWFSLQKEVS